MDTAEAYERTYGIRVSAGPVDEQQLPFEEAIHPDPPQQSHSVQEGDLLGFGYIPYHSLIFFTLPIYF